eukprot:GDKI01033226.1.p1 GENE.GDKI01033226.1~~GDKI01033226.1.p1  ORF type:complete len:155 (+),score=37.63 GDKI01033226.1:155-619(+)
MILGFVIVGLLWGATTPFIKEGGLDAERQQEEKGDAQQQKRGKAKGEEDTQGKNKAAKGGSFLGKVFGDLFALLKNWKFLVPYLLNQSGSVAYYRLLGQYDLSLAMPIANTLSLVFTFLTELIVFKQAPTLRATLGCSLILAGAYMCMNSNNSA